MRVGLKVKLVITDKHGTEKKYVAKVVRVTGVAVKVTYRNKNGTWTEWLDKDLKKSAWPWATYQAFMM